MFNYFKADLFRIVKERKLTISIIILLLLSLLSAFLFHGEDSAGYTISLLQLLSQFITLFFIVPSNIFFGEDFSYRTVNNVIIKQQQRKKIFFYKVFIALIFNIIYVLLAYISSGLFRTLLGDQCDFLAIFKTFLNQFSIFVCISLLCTTLFIALKKVTQAYLVYILIVLLFDNVSRLITTNILSVKLPTEYFLFSSLQSGEVITNLTITISLIFSLIYFVLSYHIFNTKELK